MLKPWEYGREKDRLCPQRASGKGFTDELLINMSHDAEITKVSHGTAGTSSGGTWPSGGGGKGRLVGSLCKEQSVRELAN